MKALWQKLKQNKKLRTTIIAVFVAVVFFCCAGFIISQSADISRLGREKEAYSKQLEEQNAENDELQGVLESDDKDSYIEQKAREKGYVKPDEDVFYDAVGSN